MFKCEGPVAPIQTGSTTDDRKGEQKQRLKRCT